ncbi:MAG: hypothetical protein K0Q73_3951 [Paenibacillus sp.]|nr:hypothetical protein [Paenibacillus sp.]
MSAISNYKKCQMYMGRTVKIKDKHGRTYTGKIMKVDGKKVHLKVASVQDGKKVHASFFPFILPLVLFDLLVIALLF